MAAASPVLRLGLLRMRPVQFWLKQRVPSAAWRHGRHLLTVTRACVSALIRWRDPLWLTQGVILDTAHRRKVVTTDASNKGWGALCEGKPTFGLWSEEESGLPINCLEMLAVCHACQFFLPDIRGHHVLIRSDSRSVVSYINHQGGLVSKRLCTLAKNLLVWAQTNLRSLKATHVPGKMNQGADMLSRNNVSSEEWTLHPLAVQRIWEVFGRARIDLFASEDKIYFTRSTDALAHEWPSLPLYAFPPIALLPQVLRRVREQRHRLLLIAPLWRNQPWVSELFQLVNLVLSSLLQIDWFANPSLCLLNDDSGLCISLIQKRMLFAGFTAAKKTIIQNWFTPHMCGKTYWIHSLLQIVTCECTTAQMNGAKPSTIDDWQCFSSNIRDYIKEWLVVGFFFSLSPFWLDFLIREYTFVVLLCFVCFE